VTGKMMTPPPPAPVPTPAQPASSSTARSRPPEPAAAAAPFSSADLPLRPPEAKSKSKQYLGGFRQYRCDEVSSEGSKWKRSLPQEEGRKSLAQMGILVNDISYAHANTPGVCVLRAMSLPNVPPASQQEATVKFLKKSIRLSEKQDAKDRKAYEVKKALLAKRGADGGDAGISSEVLPKHQRKTAGKPAICRPIPPTHEAMAQMMNAEDSHFTSEYRRNGWWKALNELQKKELKEHVRPLDGWTMFRDRAAEVNKFSRFPINTY